MTLRGARRRRRPKGAMAAQLREQIVARTAALVCERKVETTSEEKGGTDW